MCLCRSLHLLVLQVKMMSSCLRLGPCVCHICSKECPVALVSPAQGVIKQPDHHGIHHGKMEFSKMLSVLAE